MLDRASGYDVADVEAMLTAPERVRAVPGELAAIGDGYGALRECHEHVGHQLARAGYAASRAFAEFELADRAGLRWRDRSGGRRRAHWRRHAGRAGDAATVADRATRPVRVRGHASRAAAVVPTLAEQVAAFAAARTRDADVEPAAAR